MSNPAEERRHRTRSAAAGEPNDRPDGCNRFPHRIGKPFPAITTNSHGTGRYELPARVAGYNITCAIHEMYKMDVTPDGRPPWWNDAKMFGQLTLLNFVLIWLGVCCGAGCGAVEPAALWLWAFAFPASVAAASRGWQSSVAVVLLLLNPLIYGAVWWCVLKMFHLLRPKPTEGDSPPLHNE